jgi:hypothetical protein
VAITNGLITLADAKAQLGIATGTTTYDADIELYVEAATPIVEAITGPMVQASRTFTLNGGSSVLALPVKFTSVTSVTVGGVATTSYDADPLSGLIYSETGAFASGIQNVVVVVAVGSATIPSNVKLAARELVRHWWQTSRQANRPGTAEQVAQQPLPLGVSRRIGELLAPNAGLAGFA